METLENININFDQNQVTLLNICLGFLMFGVALDLKIDDFKYIFKAPKSIISGLLSQWILLPILTMVLVYIIQPTYSLALGMVLIAACPGGNVSNYAVHLAKANAALSIMLTMISTLLCVFSTPTIFSILESILPERVESQMIFEIKFADMIWSIGQLIIIPLILGFILSNYYPLFTNKIKKSVKKVSFIIFVSFVIVAVAGNFENLKKYLYLVFLIVFIHNSLALLVGYFWSRRIMNLPIADSRTISIETGIQNSGLALILIFNFFDGNGGMALIAAWWSIWHLISALSLAWWWRRKQILPT
ncbi:MAG: bile acid:sodium symporter family protein [Saprospiraceae bacterium]|nr:bile acid:sodium symporter family protein [Saprospiraceae bacterium]